MPSMKLRLASVLLLAAATTACGARTPFGEDYVPFDVPSVDAPTVDVPVVDVPSVDGPTVDRPTVDVPSVDTSPVDVPSPDVPITCRPGEILCGRVCTNSQVDPLNCGACGVVCTGGTVCNGGCVKVFCPPEQTRCGGVCVDTSTDPRNCGGCGILCPAGLSCQTGACAPATPVDGPYLRIDSLGTTGCNAVEHAAITGDDRGGIAVGVENVYYLGDEALGAFNLDSLAGVRQSFTGFDLMASNLRNGEVYQLLGPGGVVPGPDGTLVQMGRLGQRGTSPGVVRLSSPIPLRAGEFLGIFSGSDRVVIVSGTTVYDIALGTGVVTPRGTIPAIPHTPCETRAIWGVAERFDGALWLAYVSDTTHVSRTRVGDGATQTVGTFANLADMCAFSVSPTRNRWYWHHEGTSQFRAGDESIGYCPARIVTTDMPTAGYTQTARTTPLPFLDACGAPGHTTLLATVDDQSAPAPLAFDFRYWGRTVPAGSMLTIASNGYLSFTPDAAITLGGMLGTSAEPNAVVALHWGDLFTRADGVCVATVGAAPNRRQVVEWSNAHYCCTDDPAVGLTFEAVFTETTNEIDLLYRDMRGLRPLPAGLEDFSGTASSVVCDGSPMCAITTGTAVHFVPTP